MQPEQRVQFTIDVEGIERFVEEGLRTTPKRQAAALVVALARDHDHLQAGVAFEQLLQRVHAGKPGHVAVEDHRVELAALAQVERAAAVAGLGHVDVEDAVGEHLPDDAAHGRGIVDHQHVARHRDAAIGLEDSQHIQRGERLGHELIDLELQRELHAQAVGVGRHQRHEGLVADRARLSDRVHAAHLGHVHVDEGQMDAARVERIHALLAVAHVDDVERNRRVRGNPVEHLVDDAGVVRDQNLELERLHNRPPVGREHAPTISQRLLTFAQFPRRARPVCPPD